VQPGDCVTVNNWPAMTADPVRCGPSVGVTLIATGPGPLPLAGVTVIHSALLAAVHGHAGAVLTATVVGPPFAPTECAARSMEYVQP